MNTPTTHRLAVRLTIEPRDPYRWVTLGATGLVTLAVAMAVFGLPPIDLHPPTHWFGIMDPLCGGTRAARYTVLGQWAAAWNYNPLGILAVLAVSALLLRGAVGLVTCRWPTLRVTWSPRARQIMIAVAVILVVLLEVRQQGRAELLMDDTFTFVDYPLF
ncbi:DUF2752 domain-containing protein [Nocardioides sp. NPDC057767]|uniref:Uncharacterized protein DUF2752 n=1 Tax=Nocardioides albertanoniae TaxID=1175486 RepID=A0A543A8P7_9ACTN|nr:DUF2752 domain-containing protein [Nocardioides albertanoniae]TQL68909.1 uncharacterized protein DUF2752 [Nocardioides albertanoniae]